MKLHPYRGTTAAIATKHLKEQIIAPIFGELGVSLEVAAVDTDLLGTFTGEIEREGTPKEVAIAKARLGMAATGLPYGLASEGSIGPDPIVPFLSSDIECLAWVDDRLGIEIVEFHRSMEIRAAHGVLSEIADLDEFLTKADFPNHGLIIKSDSQIFKGVTNRGQLQEILNKLSGNVIIENDLRAHFSPTRQKNISAVAKQLAGRLAVLCDACETPGWGVVGNIYGLECRECGGLNEKAVRGRLMGCAKCENRKEVISDRSFVAPADCEFCNP